MNPHAEEPAIVPGRPRVAVPCGATIGEGPVWDHRTGTLFWVDIRAGTLWRWRPGDALATPIALGEAAGFVVLTPDPGVVLLGLKSGLARLDLGGGRPEIVLRPEPDRPGNRLNDATVAPDGSLYFGSMDDAERAPTGRFYRWSAAGLEPFGQPAIVTNGPAVDPPSGRLYAVDTTARTIHAHTLGPDGTPGPAEPFVRFAEGDGHPDGITIDADGHVWVCHWGGARVTRFDPDGRAVLVLPMPTGQVTKVAFGGPDLATLYVTSAAIGRDRETDLQAGHVFAIETGIRGRPAEFCRMGTA